MEILITGVDGYIGKALYDYLSNKYNVLGINRGKCNLRDCREVERVFANKKFDAVIHTAAQGGSRLEKDAVEDLYDNLQMFLNLLKHRGKYGRFIHFGSGAQFVHNDFYALSKKIISSIMQELDVFYNIIIYGLFDHNELPTRFIKSSVRKALKQDDIIIHKNKKMDFFHMEDLKVLVDYYLTFPTPRQTLECCYKTSLTLLEIASIIKDLCNSKSKIRILNVGLGAPYTGINSATLNSIIEKDFLERLKESVLNIRLNG